MSCAPRPGHRFYHLGIAFNVGNFAVDVGGPNATVPNPGLFGKNPWHLASLSVDQNVTNLNVRWQNRPVVDGGAMTPAQPLCLHLDVQLVSNAPLRVTGTAAAAGTLVLTFEIPCS